jgi:DNA-binding transcriptional regulator PaaX
VPSWLMLMFRIPTQPSALRVSTWRKLKRLGAVVLHDAVWVLPATATTREQLQWLAAEIAEAGGEATVWRSEVELGDDRPLVAEFAERANAAYAEILADLRREDADRSALARRYLQVKALDYFQAPLGDAVREALLGANGGGGA